jgi:hypothetical protein
MNIKIKRSTTPIQPGSEVTKMQRFKHIIFGMKQDIAGDFCLVEEVRRVRWEDDNKALNTRLELEKEISVLQEQVGVLNDYVNERDATIERLKNNLFEVSRLARAFATSNDDE